MLMETLKIGITVLIAIVITSTMLVFIFKRKLYNLPAARENR